MCDVSHVLIASGIEPVGRLHGPIAKLAPVGRRRLDAAVDRPDAKTSRLGRRLEVRETADSITATSQSLKDLIGSPDLETTIARLDRSLQDATAGADQTMNRAIDRMTWRLGLLLVIAFLLGVALVLVAGWQKKRLAARE